MLHFSRLEQITHRHAAFVAGAKKGRGEKRGREKAEAVPHPLSFCTSTPPATQDNHHKIQDLPVPNVSVQPILKCE